MIKISNSLHKSLPETCSLQEVNTAAKKVVLPLLSFLPRSSIFGNYMAKNCISQFIGKILNYPAISTFALLGALKSFHTNARQ